MLYGQSTVGDVFNDNDGRSDGVGSESTKVLDDDVLSNDSRGEGGREASGGMMMGMYLGVGGIMMGVYLEDRGGMMIGLCLGDAMIDWKIERCCER